jgi:hypothetical protein
MYIVYLVYLVYISYIYDIIPGCDAAEEQGGGGSAEADDPHAEHVQDEGAPELHLI